jgi:hypothetical protein
MPGDRWAGLVRRLLILCKAARNSDRTSSPAATGESPLAVDATFGAQLMSCSDNAQGRAGNALKRRHHRSVHVRAASSSCACTGTVAGSWASAEVVAAARSGLGLCDIPEGEREGQGSTRGLVTRRAVNLHSHYSHLVARGPPSAPSLPPAEP